MWGPRIRKDEADIKSLIDMMENNWMNTLSPGESDLVSLVTGTVPPPAVVKDLLRVLEVGEESYQTFKWIRLDDDPPSVKFHDKMTKHRLKTLSTISTNTFRMKGQNVVLKTYRNLFSLVILVAESISVNMKDVLAHPLGPLPWALANADGSLRKTNKAALATELEKKCVSCRSYPNSINLHHWWDGSVRQQQNICTTGWVCLVHDTVCGCSDWEGWCCLWRIPPAVHQRFWKTKPRCKHLSLVFQNLWWCKHNTSVQMPTGGHNIQQWRQFLCSSFDKTILIKFLVGEWKLQRYRYMLHGHALNVTCKYTCFKMTADEWVEVAELQSTQEEAETILLLYALHAARTGSKVVIVTCEDTDVILLCLAFQKDIPCPIYQKCGT